MPIVKLGMWWLKNNNYHVLLMLLLSGLKGCSSEELFKHDFPVPCRSSGSAKTVFYFANIRKMELHDFRIYGEDLIFDDFHYIPHTLIQKFHYDNVSNILYDKACLSTTLQFINDTMFHISFICNGMEFKAVSVFESGDSKKYYRYLDIQNPLCSQNTEEIFPLSGFGIETDYENYLIIGKCYTEFDDRNRKHSITLVRKEYLAGVVGKRLREVELLASQGNVTRVTDCDCDEMQHNIDCTAKSEAFGIVPYHVKSILAFWLFVASVFIVGLSLLVYYLFNRWCKICRTAPEPEPRRQSMAGGNTNSDITDTPSDPIADDSL